MIAANGTYFLYRHIRLDKMQPFYIGVGKKEFRSKSHKSVYSRAYNTRSRNIHWKNIVNKSMYSVEILLESDSREFILNKEMEFIEMYGISSEGGCLVNITRGGNYNGTTVSSGNNNFVKKSKSVFAYNLCGDLIKTFDSQHEASRYFGKTNSYVYNAIKYNCSMGDYVFSNEFLGEHIDISLFNIKKRKSFGILKLDPISKDIINEYESVREAINLNGFVDSESIYSAIRKRQKYGGFYWIKKSEYSRILDIKFRKRGHNKKLAA